MDSITFVTRESLKPVRKRAYKPKTATGCLTCRYERHAVEVWDCLTAFPESAASSAMRSSQRVHNVQEAGDSAMDTPMLAKPHPNDNLLLLLILSSHYSLSIMPSRLLTLSSSSTRRDHGSQVLFDQTSGTVCDQTCCSCHLSPPSRLSTAETTYDSARLAG
jgi:hypothetical protein